MLARDLDFGDRVTVITSDGGDAPTGALNYAAFAALGAAAVVQAAVTPAGSLHIVGARRGRRPRHERLGRSARLARARRRTGGSWCIAAPTTSSASSPACAALPRRARCSSTTGCSGSIDSDGALAHAVAGTQGGLSPAWHPSARYVAYDEMANTGHQTIVVRDLTTGATHRYATRHTLNITPAFSPDGNTLAFAAGDDGTDIYAVAPFGDASPRRLSAGQGSLNTQSLVQSRWPPDRVHLRSTRSSRGVYYGRRRHEPRPADHDDLRRPAVPLRPGLVAGWTAGGVPITDQRRIPGHGDQLAGPERAGPHERRAQRSALVGAGRSPSAVHLHALGHAAALGARYGVGSYTPAHARRQLAHGGLVAAISTQRSSRSLPRCPPISGECPCVFPLVSIAAIALTMFARCRVQEEARAGSGSRRPLPCRRPRAAEGQPGLDRRRPPRRGGSRPSRPPKPRRAAAPPSWRALRNAIAAKVYFDFDKDEIRDDAEGDARRQGRHPERERGAAAPHRRPHGRSRVRRVQPRARASAARPRCSAISCRAAIAATRFETVSFGKERPPRRARTRTRGRRTAVPSSTIIAGGDNLRAPR